MPDVQLRTGEEVVHVAGGQCVVCKKPVAKGQAVQISKYTIKIRHTTCFPQSDTRRGRPGRRTIPRVYEKSDSSDCSN